MDRFGSVQGRRRFGEAQPRPHRSESRSRIRMCANGACVRPANVSFVSLVVEIRVDPGEYVGSLVRVVRPARRDDTHPPAGYRIALCGRMEHRRIDRVEDEVGSISSMPRARCASRLYRDWTIVASASCVDLGDPCVRSVVEPAVRPDRAVDAMDEAHIVACEPAKTAEVEVEGIEEACCRPLRDAIDLDEHAPTPELPTSARRNWWPPPVGGGANSWKSARSARPRLVPDALDLRSDFAGDRCRSPTRSSGNPAHRHRRDLRPIGSVRQEAADLARVSGHVRLRSTVSRALRPSPKPAPGRRGRL